MPGPMFADAAEVIFEVDWDSAPLSTAGVWTDESAYARVDPSITTRRGRQSELEEFSYGTMRVELDNRTRRFDPSYSAGALFGKLLPRKRCRLRLKWSGTTYDVFTGWLTGFPQNYGEGRTDSTVTIMAVDSLAVLAEMGLTLDVFNDFTPTPERHMQSFSGGTWVERISGLSNAAPDFASSSAGSVDLIGSGGRPARGVNSLASGWTSSLVTTLATSYTVSFWIQIDGQAAGSLQSTVLTGTSGGNFTQVYLTFGDGATATARMTVVISIGATDNIVCGYGLFDGQVHHVTISTTSGLLTTVYIDGVQQVQQTITSSPAAWYMTGYARGASVAAVDGSFFLQDVQQFGTALTAAQVLELYNRGKGQIIEPTTTRAARYLDNVAWPSAWRDLAPTTGLGAARGECADVQQSGHAHNALNVAAATEQGRYFAKKNGDVAFYGRYYAFEVARGKDVQATLSDDGNDIKYSATGIDWSDREVNNDITVNWSNEPAKRSTDSTSITAYTRQSKTITTVLSTGAAATDMAAGLVGWRKDLRSRTRGIVVDARSNSTHWATLLGLEIGDRIRHEITPMGVGSQDVRDLTLEAIEWEISGDQYIVTLYGSPIPTDVFVLDSSLLDTGRLGF